MVLEKDGFFVIFYIYDTNLKDGQKIVSVHFFGSGLFILYSLIEYVRFIILLN